MRAGSNGYGLALAVVSAAAFSTSGTFASALIDAGWTPGAAVTARIAIAALALTVPAILQLRGRWADLRRGLPMVAAYGLVAVAGCQVCFFYAVQHLSVGVALLLEYLGIILVVIWVWLRHGQRPRPLTIVGGVGALVGLVLVLDLTGPQHADVAGVLWGLAAAVGLATFFVLSSAADEPLPPLAMAWAGMTLGSIALVAVAAAGGLPIAMPHHDVRLLDARMSWLVPVLGLSLLAAAFAYVTGIGAARRLGARLASFVGLTEVLFAILVAWVALNQLPGAMQAVGGLLILAGVTLVRVDELRDRTRAVESAVPDPVPTG